MLNKFISIEDFVFHKTCFPRDELRKNSKFKKIICYNNNNNKAHLETNFNNNE